MTVSRNPKSNLWITFLHGKRAAQMWVAFFFAPVAQWLEQRTHNPLVVGSSPTRRTSNLNNMEDNPQPKNGFLRKFIMQYKEKEMVFMVSHATADKGAQYVHWPLSRYTKDYINKTVDYSRENIPDIKKEKLVNEIFK